MEIETTSNRKIITKESLEEEFNDLLTLVDTEIDKKRKSFEKNKGIRKLIQIKKRVESIRKHIPKMIKHSRSINRDPSKNGFVIPTNISKELSKFLSIDPNTKLSRENVQCAISTYIHIDPEEDREKITRWKYLNPDFRDLRSVSNKRVIQPDDKLSSLLDYDKYREDVKKGLIEINNKKLGKKIVTSDDSLYYYILTKLIQKHFIKNK